MMMEVDKPVGMHQMHHQSDWGHPQLGLQQQVITTNHPITDDIRFSIINAISQKQGIWDSQREKTAGPSRKEMFGDVTAEVNQQHRIDPPLSPEEVEKQWKNLKDTYIKTRKKLTYNPEGLPIPPKWKFYSSLTFLESLMRGGNKRRYDDDDALMPQCMPMQKRLRTEEEVVEEDDEYMGFCRSLVYPLRDIGFKDRLRYLKLQKSIRDMIHDVQVDLMLGHMR